MVFTLRKKLILGFIGLDIAISLLLGIFMYEFAYGMFLENFKNNKTSIAKFISSSIQGEEHEEIKSIKDFENPNFKKYVDLLERIYKTEKSVRYIYTLNYDSKTDNLYYAIDANKLDRDNVWVETEHFAYSVYQKDDKEFTANYDYFLRTGQFEIKTKKLGTTKHEFVKENDKTFLKINDQVVFEFISEEPLIAKTKNGILNKENRFINTSIQLGEYYYPLKLSYSAKGLPASEPGAVYMETPERITNLKQIIQNEIIAEVDSDITHNAYGKIMSAYSTIFSKDKKPVGLVILDINTKEMDDFRNKMMLIAFGLSFCTFFATTFVAFFLARHFTRPLEILSAAVDNLASGNLIMIENINKKDEFGNLAKSFNVMVNNLKIASEVQYNLIVEISNFNESLEKKVEERTRTIQEQSQELEKQIMIAKKIQLSLLPEDVPKINGANLSFRYQPMMGVGGDFIDFDYKNGDDLLLFICDVSGHGVPAAFLATMVKMSLQDCYELKLSPAESLKKIHRALQGKLSGHFLSAIYCHINLQDGIMTSANAGHLPILKVGLSGTYEFINSRGRIICEAFPTNSEEVTTKLEIGDKIILY
ncbi:MAG: SpoIIE family protein phosphatase, partial [Leptospiraceae bacterium]|nr:SpoIIE family protein phosphatase [Leptospiraceae bacterium]